MRRKLCLIALIVLSILLGSCKGMSEPAPEPVIETEAPPVAVEDSTAGAAPEEPLEGAVLPPRNLPVPVLGQEVRRVNGNRLSVSAPEYQALMQVGDWLYLNLPVDGPVSGVQFYMLKADGSKQIQIVESQAYDLHCIGDFVYFETREHWNEGASAYCRLPLGGGVLETQAEPFAASLAWVDFYDYQGQRYVWRDNALYRDQEVLHQLPEGHSCEDFSAWQGTMAYLEHWWSEEEYLNWGYGGDLYAVNLLDLETGEARRITNINDFNDTGYFDDYFGTLLTERYLLARGNTYVAGLHHLYFWDRQTEELHHTDYDNLTDHLFDSWNPIVVAVGDYLYLCGQRRGQQAEFWEYQLTGFDERDGRYWPVGSVFPNPELNGRLTSLTHVDAMYGGEDALYVYVTGRTAEEGGDWLYQLYRFDLATGAASRIWESLL